MIRGVLDRHHLLARQVLRFGAVGVANTAVYYACYRGLLLFTPYLAAHTASWVVSVVFSYFANAVFTYRVRPSWRTFVAYPSTTLANLAFTTGGSWMSVELLDADERYITVIMGILAIPLTFVLTRWVLGGPRPPARRPTPSGTA